MLRWFENLVDPYQEDQLNRPFPKSFFAFAWEVTQKFRIYLAMIVLLSAAIAYFEVLIYHYLGELVNWLSSTDRDTFLQLHQQGILLLVGVLLANFLCIALHSLIIHQVLHSSFPQRLRWRFHNLLLAQSVEFFHNDFAGRLSAKVMQTALAAREFWLILTDLLVYAGVYFITINLFFANISPALIVPLIIWLLLFLLIGVIFIPRLAKVSQQQADARSVMTGRVTDAYTNIQTVKLFSHAGRESRYAKESMHIFLRTVFKQMRLALYYEVAIKLLNVYLLLSVIGCAVWLWIEGRADLGLIAATTAIVLKLNNLSDILMWHITSLFENVGTIQDGMRTLGKSISIQDKHNAKALQVVHGQIEFRDVCFAYKDRRVIDNFNLCIASGEKIGIVGRSGAGKSTLIQLLLHFYRLNGGQILIDGQDIDEVSQDSLRTHIALVSQDTSLLHRSVLENIQYGRPEASLEEVRAAIDRAHATEFIDELVDKQGHHGLAAQVGERGVKLSGGQRQRIAIARVFLKNAPILVLDEATSALDSEVEAAIQDSLEQLMANKTVIAIAHRLSTIAKMDRLIVIEQGRILEQGTHAELIAANGLYAKLWMRQSGGFLSE